VNKTVSKFAFSNSQLVPLQLGPFADSQTEAPKYMGSLVGLDTPRLTHVIVVRHQNTHSTDDSRYGPCNQSDTPREWRQP
jgi:hypothetical protein